MIRRIIGVMKSSASRGLSGREFSTTEDAGPLSGVKRIWRLQREEEEFGFSAENGKFVNGNGRFEHRRLNSSVFFGNKKFQSLS